MGIMGAVPHSGNEVDEAAVKALTPSPKRSGGLLSGLPAQKSSEYEKTIITRAAFEALCDKAGVRMDWNGGQPVLHDDDVEKYTGAWEAAERAERKLQMKQMERILQKQQGGLISQSAANSMAASAANAMDKTVSDIIRKKVNETLREDMHANEERVKAKLKEGGATDDDIAAAEAVLGWKPEVPESVTSSKLQAYLCTLETEMRNITALNDLLASPTVLTVIARPSAPLTQDDIRRTIEALKRNDVPPAWVMIASVGV